MKRDGGMSPRNVTLKDVAVEVGCSLISASRVLNSSPDAHVGAEMREKILAAAARLHYVPSRAAKTLRARNSKTIGLVAGGLCGHYQSCIIDALFKESLRRGYQFKIVLTEYDRKQEQKALEEILKDAPDSIFYQPDLDPDSPIARYLHERNYPLLVLGGQAYPNLFHSVASDRESFWDDVCRVFLARGHREITVQGELRSPVFDKYAKKYGLSFHCIRQKDSTREALDAVFAEMAGCKIRALVSLQSFDAQNYFFYLTDRGLPVPDCIGVYGIPGELVRHPNYLGAIVTDLPDYVQACFDRMLHIMEHPGEPFLHTVFPRRYLSIGQLRELREKQLKDPRFALYAT